MRFQNRSGTLNWQLTKIVFGIFVPAVCFAAVLLWQFAASERSRVEEEARSVSRGFAVALDREIHGVLTTLQALATSPALQSGDYAVFYKQVSEVSHLQGINISLRDFSGRAILTTRAPLGENVAVPRILAEADQEILRSGAPLVTDIFTSTVADRPVFQIMTAPIYVADQPALVLGASIDLSYLGDVLKKEHMPQGWYGAIVDRKGVFVARTVRHDEFSGKPVSADYRASTSAESGSYYGQNSEGRPVLVGYAKSALTGWTTGATLLAADVNAPLRRSVSALVALGLLLAAIAMAIVLFTGRRLGKAFGSITDAAMAIGRGQLVEPIVTTITEVNQVGQALHSAAYQLRDRAVERDGAEAALRKLNATLEEQVEQQTRERNRLWETTNDLVGTSDMRGNLTVVNPAWTRLLGWTNQELLSRPLTEFIEDVDRVHIAELIDHPETIESSKFFLTKLLSKNGIPHTLMWSAILDRDANLLYMVGRDMTEQRRAEDALRQSQKMEALGHLTGGIAHDFNNMLAVIMGSLNLMQRRLERGESNLSRYVEGALDGAKRAASLTQRLLAFSRQQPLSPEPIDANRMIADMADLLTRTLGEQSHIETVLAAGLWRAVADASELENVILNLAVNARDAMPAGGKLTIETANSHIDDQYARDHELTAGQYVLISVTDTGSGMSAETVAKAFDPFFTTKAVGQGTGLGLSQVFGVARQSGGHVKIYSEIGHGTTVKLYLPRSYDDASRLAKVKKIAGDVKGGEINEIIMVVEDEERVRSYAVEALRELGYTVVHASDGPAALRLLEAGQNVSLLFTDIIMPEMTGRQLVDAVRSSRPHLKVLYMTGYSRNAVVHNGALDPGTNLLIKPFGIANLAEAVRNVLDN